MLEVMTAAGTCISANDLANSIGIVVRSHFQVVPCTMRIGSFFAPGPLDFMNQRFAFGYCAPIVTLGCETDKIDKTLR